MSRFSCKGCTRRTVGCHSTCKDYIKEKNKHNKKMREYRKSVGLTPVDYQYNVEPKAKSEEN